jgi:hypothetical protein
MNFSHKSANHLRNLGMAFAISITLLLASSAARAQKDADEYLFNDSHFHLTNYIQEGIDIHDFLKVMGNKAGRVALFGIPLQQQWSYRVDENRGPQVSFKRRPGPLRSDDHRLQSDGHVCRGSHSPGAQSFSRRLHRYR